MAKDKKVKTNVMRILDAEHIAYTEHTYEVEDGKIDGVSVALKCGEDPDQVFKTLVTEGNDRNFYVFVVPVKQKLDLKACAAAAGVKSVEMIPQKDLLKTTGYIHGGCSPVGMKKLFPTFIDETAILFDHIFVSAGKIGCQIEISPDALHSIVPFHYAALTV